jgi:hypothetical protein
LRLRLSFVSLSLSLFLSSLFRVADRDEEVTHRDAHERSHRAAPKREREREGERRLTGKRDEKLVVVDVEKL